MPKRKIPAPQGFAAPGFERVLGAFRSSFSEGSQKGASLAIYFKGSLAVRAWGGFADEQTRRPWTEDGYGYFFSGAKFLTAVVIADLVQKGRLKYEEKVATYWPQFAQNGKEEITLNMLMCHTAGLPVANEDYHLQWIRDDPTKMRAILERLHPLWVPGKQHGYSNVLLGLFLNEIVQRVDHKGRSISQYFQDEIAVPFDLDLHIGVPASSFHRTPRLAWQDYSQQELSKAMSEFTGNVELYQRSMREPRDWNSRWRINDPSFASLPSPSSHAIGSPKAMAKLASILATDGTRTSLMHDGKAAALLAKPHVQSLQKPMVEGVDFIFGSKWTYGLGTMVMPARMGDKTWFLFGHTGLGGQCVWADPLHGVGFGFTSNYMDPLTTFHHNPWRRLMEVTYDCLQGLHYAEGPSSNPRQQQQQQHSLQLFESYQDYVQDLKSNPISSKL